MKLLTGDTFTTADQRKHSCLSDDRFIFCQTDNTLPRGGEQVDVVYGRRCRVDPNLLKLYKAIDLAG